MQFQSTTLMTRSEMEIERLQLKLKLNHEPFLADRERNRIQVRIDDLSADLRCPVVKAEEHSVGAGVYNRSYVAECPECGWRDKAMSEIVAEARGTVHQRECNNA